MSAAADPAVRRRRVFRPNPWLTVFALAAFVVLVGLGCWQLERRSWKHEIIADLAHRLAEPPLTTLPATPDESIQYRRVQLTGHFRPNADQLLVGRSHRDTTGYGVFTPFEIPGGGTVFVDRGWIPLSARGDSAWQIPAEGRSGMIAGVVRLARPSGDARTSLGNEHYRLDVAAMARQAGLDPRTVLPFTVIAQGMDGTGAYPVPGTAAVEVADNHLQYALTWFTLAASLLAVYAVASFQPVPIQPRHTGEGP